MSGHHVGAGRVYVLIVNWRGWRDTLECLESVFRQDYPDYRVVVCDNASGDDSLERLREWAEGRRAAPDAAPRLAHLSMPAVAKPIAYVECDAQDAETAGAADPGMAPLVLIRSSENLGFAGGTNAGLRFAEGRGDAEFVWLLNNDTVVDAGALRAMVELARGDQQIGMAGSRLLYYDEPDIIQAIGGGRFIPWQGRTELLGRDHRDNGQWGEPVDVDYITGASLLVRSEVVRSVGLLDERYFLYSEELDWCIRARQRGWRLTYAPESRVWHKEGRSVGSKSERSDYYGVRSALLLVAKFRPRLLPSVVLYSVYRSVLPKVVRGQPRRLRAVLRAYRDARREIRARAVKPEAMDAG